MGAIDGRQFADHIVGMSDSGNPPFEEYLEAKVEVDDASLHQKTFERFTSLLSTIDSPRILDVGTGTGAMIRRLLGIQLKGDAIIQGLDTESTSLQRAKMLIGTQLRQTGGEINEDEGQIVSIENELRKTIQFLKGDFLSKSIRESLITIPYHCITANAFMDLVPPNEAVHIVSDLLVPGGIFYTTINYDGITSLFPSYGDASFENELLSIYNDSMDKRERAGLPVGGSRTGSRIYNILIDRGFVIEGFGASDWSVFPWDGRYAGSEALLLRRIVQNIYREAKEEGKKKSQRDQNREQLNRWLEDRMDRISTGELALVVHQTDLLSRMSA